MESQQNNLVITDHKQYDESSGQVQAFTSLADQFLNQGYKKFQFAAQAVNIDQYSNELGLGDISKQLTADRLKTLLAAYAMVSLMAKLKSNIVKVGAVAVVGALVLKNKDYFKSVFNESSYIAERLPDNPYYPDSQFDSEFDIGLSGKYLGDFGN